jgi:phospholipid-transporting ATPase
MAGPYRRGADTHGDDNLLDLLDDQPTSYNPGRPPAHDDDYLARQHNLPGSAQTTGRPSPYNDDFVGGSGGAGASVIRPVDGSATGSSQPRPSYLGADNRAYSQTSDLHNYDHHAEIDDYPEDDIGDLQDYYGAGGLDDNVPAATLRHKSARNRNSILSLGGGLVGRARNMLGMGAQYSEMDLPLTDTAAKPAAVPLTSTTTTTTEPTTNGHTQPSQHKPPKKPLAERVKILFGQGEIDYSTLGPRLIYLNNPPANAEITSPRPNTTSSLSCRNSSTSSSQNTRICSSCLLPCCNRSQMFRQRADIPPLYH